jgi:hypothetical protein
MSKLRVITFASLLFIAIAVGCSSSDQGAIDKAVSATLTAAQPATAAPVEEKTSDLAGLPDIFLSRLRKVFQ